jgi:hypothetical protein
MYLIIGEAHGNSAAVGLYAESCPSESKNIIYLYFI